VNRLFLEAVLAFLALPGVVGYVIPLVCAPERDRLDVRGIGLVGVGSTLLLACVWQFYSLGKGTLAPWTPPVHLVDRGPYRFSRNPMYVAVVTVLFGWALAFTSPGLAAYAVVMIAVFHARVVLFEEPWLAERHGESWRRYRASVPRWVGIPRAVEADGIAAGGGR
jgi:protein-S-isoprenylcysteine O-methyltransferase Ste14